MGVKNDQKGPPEPAAEDPENQLKPSKVEEEDDVVEESVKSGDDKKQADSGSSNPNAIKIAVPNHSLPSNKITCTRYSLWTFLPAAGLALVREPSFLFYLGVLVLQILPTLTISNGFPTAIIPILFVVVLVLFERAARDLAVWRLDRLENNFKTQVLKGSTLQEAVWADIYPGQIIKILDGQTVPADCILLYCANTVRENCHVDTIEIDGQTNLTVKSRVNYPEDIKEENPYDYLNYYVNSQITFDEPNSNIASFRGSLELVGVTIPLSEANLLLRKSVLKRADFVFAVVVYTGHNTKVMQMQLQPRLKTSRIYRQIDRVTLAMSLLSVGISLFAALYHIIYLSVYQSSLSNYVNYAALNYFTYFLTKLVNWILLTL